MWQQNKVRMVFGVLMIVLIVALGFLRDFLFININFIIKQLYYNREVVEYHSMYKFLVPLDVSGLMKLKWVLTFVFMALNLLLSVLILKNIFSHSRMPLRLLYAGYVILFLISGIFYITGKFFGFSELGYTLSRRFMGVLQSPVPLMVVAAVHLLFGKTSWGNSGEPVA